MWQNRLLTNWERQEHQISEGHGGSEMTPLPAEDPFEPHKMLAEHDEGLRALPLPRGRGQGTGRH